MSKIRFMQIAVMCLIGCITALADDFNPVSPTEPGAPTIYSRIVLLRNIDDAGSVSGAGKYVVGSTVTLYAYVNSSYTFVNWTDTKGEVVGTSSTLMFVNTEQTDTLIANYQFTPGSPTEPSEPSTTLYYRLGLNSTQGSSVNGAGRYQAGKSIYVSAYVENGYDFLGWTNSKGEMVSDRTSFSYIMPIGGDTLTANCVFNPSAPAEPTEPVLRYNVTATCSDGGYYKGSTGRMLEGTRFTLNAYRNDGYDFVGWYLNGELYTTLSSFSYTVGKTNLNFHAQFRFNPASPAEPPMAALDMYSYYLMTVNGKPGDVVSYPINLVNTAVVRDMNIRLTFPAGMEVNPEDYILSDLAQGYDVTIAEAIDTISIIEEGAKLWDFTLIGGETTPSTHALLTFKVKIPDDCPTGLKHQVKINQISMTMEDGTAVTARTRNGRIGVYRNGDVNGDDNVNITDVLGTLSIMKQVEDETLIREVADPNEDGEVNISDVLGILEIMKENSNEE